METRANYIAIGIFTLLVFAMAFGFIYWLVRYGENTNAREVELIIPSNASGLKKGSAVLFNGLRVGSVLSVSLDKKDPANVYARLIVNTETPLREDTVVTIASQPLTGLANVSLVGGSGDKDLILKRDNLPVLRAKKSSLNDTLEAASKTVEIASEVLVKVNNLLGANEASLRATIVNVEKFSAALGDNATGIDGLLENVGKASTAIASLSSTLETVSTDVEGIIKAVDPEKVGSLLANAEKISGDFARNSGEFDTIINDVKRTTGEASTLVASLSLTAKALDADQIGRTLANIEKLSGTLGTVSEDVRAVMEVVKPETVRTTLANVSKITTDLARNSGKFDALIDDAGSTVSNLTSLSSTLNATIAVIKPDQLSRTLANVEGFSGDLRTTLKNVDKVVGALDGERINKAILSLEGFAGTLDKAGGQIDLIIEDARKATSNVATFTDTLDNNQENFNKIIKDATVISTRLIKTSEAITRLVGRVDGLVEADGRGLIVEATDAAKSIRKIADSFEVRADAISKGLERFSTRGLGDIEALISQSRQAVTRVEGVVKSFETNPASFLLGGKKVPEYRRQRR